MEKDQCIWSKRKYLMSSNLTSSSPTSYPSSHEDQSSWEEQAFAKDAAGLGCIWPPRSYSCSFCRREFRSAQALGGHMNVHRRDRAKINQHNELLMSHHELQTSHPHNQVQNSLTSGYLYPSSPCGLAYNNTNPNNYDPLPVLDSSSKDLREETLIPVYNSSISHKSYPAFSSKSWSNLAEAGVEGISKGFDSGCRSKGDKDKTDHVSVSLNLFVCRAYPPVQFETKDADVSLKKRKTEASSIPFFPKSSSVDTHQHHMQSKMFEFSPSSIEELDLELRLGCRPKTNL